MSLPTTQDSTPSDFRAAPAPLHDPLRIRGNALRRSLFWALVAWIPGAFWQSASSGGSATKLALHFSDSAFWIGAMNAATFAATFLQIPGAAIIEHLGKRKWFFIWTVSAHRFLYILIGLLPWFLPSQHVSSVAVMVVLIALSIGLNNFGGVAWTNWMADLVPARVRGKYFALRNRAGIATMIVTSLALGAAMDFADTTPFANIVAPITNLCHMNPLIFLLSIVFIVSGFVGILDILSFIRVDEPPMKRSAETILQRIRSPLADRQFMTYCLYWSIWTFATSFGGTLWWVYLLKFFDHLEDTHVTGHLAWWVQHRYLMSFIALPIGYQIGQFLGFPVWGRAVDRFGRKPVIFVSSTLHTISWFLWIFLSPAMLPWMALVQIGGGLAGAGQDIGNFNMMLQYNRKGGSGYQALGSVLFAIAGFTAALLCGSLLDNLNFIDVTLWQNTRFQFHADKYTVLILAAVVIKYIGDLFILPRVHDLASRPRRETVRYVFLNMYDALNATLFSPITAGVGLTTRILGAAGENVKRWFK